MACWGVSEDSRSGEHVCASTYDAPRVVTSLTLGRLGGSPPPEALTRSAAVGAGTTLRKLLVATDATAILAAWALTVALTPGGPALVRLTAILPITLVTVFLISGFGLYRARVCAARGVEVTRLADVSVLSGAAMVLVTSWLAPKTTPGFILLGSVLTFAALAVFRCVYASWLRARRLDGDYVRRVVIVGDNEEGLELERLVGCHPELGFKVAAVAPNLQQVRPLLQAHEANGVIVANSALGHRDSNLLVRELLQHGTHVLMSTGLFGIDHARLRAHPFAREPLYYVEQHHASPPQLAVKRAVDIAGASLGLVLTLPVLLAAAVAIKGQDRGPILFRQRRVGRDGRPFTLYKLRSMVRDAEKQNADLQPLNQRRDGPFFKVDSDPRVTRVGRILRATSIDELPQLFNVVQGTMSLVGPRPALLSEVARFDQELLARHRVRPGITGLWQVEARDNPSFYSYRRLDLFYIDNLSLRLDLLIVLDTLTAVLTGAILALLPKRARATSAVPGTQRIPPLLPPGDFVTPALAPGDHG